MEGAPSESLEWLKTQMGIPGTPKGVTEDLRRKEQEEKEAGIQELKAQQEEIIRKLANLVGDKHNPNGDTMTDILKQAMGEESRRPQEVLIQQLRSTLAGKKEEDPNKALLRALITQQNKTAGEGGTSTLKANVLARLLQGDNATMAKWLASLNRQEEGESELNRFSFPGEEESTIKGMKNWSGMLEKAMTNIQQKQVWPQQNLGEDWADEEVEFKQMKFEHMVAGETRTIETCTDPAEILGQL